MVANYCSVLSQIGSLLQWRNSNSPMLKKHLDKRVVPSIEFGWRSPLYVINYAGHAGNGFFQTLFDEHPEVLSIPWIHYCTSYFTSEFGEAKEVDSEKAHAFWSTKSYFRLFYNELVYFEQKNKIGITEIV